MRILLLSIALVMSGMAVNAQKLNIDNDKAEVKFEFPSDNVTGSVSGFKAEIMFDMDKLSKSTMSGTVDVNTLTTGNKGRDNHLKSADFFDVAKYPVMKFESTEIVNNKKELAMKGNLTIKDKTHPCTISFTFKDGVFEGKTTIDASMYGVAPGKKGGTVNITFLVPLAK